MLIALIAALEATLYSATRAKWGRARRQQLLMGTSTDSDRAVPLVLAASDEERGKRPLSIGGRRRQWRSHISSLSPRSTA